MWQISFILGIMQAAASMFCFYLDDLNGIAYNGLGSIFWMVTSLHFSRSASQTKRKRKRIGFIP